MSRADESAYPQDETGHSQNGMTIRERFVMAAMQGLCANEHIVIAAYKDRKSEKIAELSNSIADATLAALEQPDG